MEAAATDGAGGPIKGDLPWERPIRQITLAARADVLNEMADPWKQYMDAIERCHDQLGKVWDTVLDKNWKGEAADACHRYWGTLQQQIRGFSNNYNGVPSVLKSTGEAIREATRAIPIPIFSGNSLPGENGTGGDDAAIDGNMLYDDYQNYRGGYADFAFLHKALDEDANPSAERTYAKDSGYGRRQDQDKAYSDHDELVRKAAIENWYGENQNTANQAHEKLVTDYAHVLSNLPKPYKKFIDKDVGDEKAKDPGGHHLPGGGDGSDLSYGAGSFGAVGGAGLGVGAMHASLPATRHSAISSPPSSITDGIRLAGDADPGGAGTVGGSSLSGGSRSPLPLSWSTTGGAGGAGSFGAVGAGGGFGGTDVPATSVPANGWWDRSPSGSVGPAAPTPATKLAAGRPGATAATGGNGVGMMPHGGNSGNRERDERQTWLTEDDEDIFRAKPATPDLIE
ncbi:WXG100 family type VII secretion target [Actinocatenispora sera]|uniref:WXG100 family type VII secretion target n=1 Tax=Actinocatenispora sera TaxID=390989 RepID=UPI0033CCA705